MENEKKNIRIILREVFIALSSYPALEYWSFVLNYKKLNVFAEMAKEAQGITETNIIQNIILVYILICGARLLFSPTESSYSEDSEEERA